MALSGCLTSDQGIDGWQRITFEGDVCSFFDPAAMGVHGPLTPEECR